MKASSKAPPERTPLVLTVGHSTLPIEAFLGRLLAHSVKRLVDVRTIPRSRYNPQFNSDALADALQDAGIGYVHVPGLGGLRHARKDSINTGWRNASFRGYADYMQTPEFEKNLARLVELAGREQIAIMCAEAVPWRCHRSMIADALTPLGIAVEHIMTDTDRRPHALTPFARLEGTRVTYPSPEPQQRSLIEGA